MRGAPAVRAALAACVALLAVVSLIATVPPARADLARPGWVAGSRWSYTYANYGISGGNLTLYANGTYVVEAVGTAEVTVGGVAYACNRARLYANFTTPMTFYEIAGDVYYRSSDFATVEQDLRVTVTAGLLHATTWENITDAPPLPIAWPLVAGASWSASTEQSVTITFNGSPSTTTALLAYEYRVGTNVQRTVPAGTFDATPLNATDGGGNYTLQYWSSTAGFWVEEDFGYASSIEQLRLSSYRLQPANTPPTAGFTWSPADGDTSTRFTFTSTSTDAQDPSTALRVRWDWNGDGAWDTDWSTNPNATHTFASPGVYNVTLEVMDTGGLTANRTEQVTVAAANPLASSVLGLPLYIWIVIAVAIAAVGVGFLLLRRRSRTPPPVPPAPPPPP